jgi:hypothetical protein
MYEFVCPVCGGTVEKYSALSQVYCDKHGWFGNPKTFIPTDSVYSNPRIKFIGDPITKIVVCGDLKDGELDSKGTDICQIVSFEKDNHDTLWLFDISGNLLASIPVYQIMIKHAQKLGLFVTKI